MGIFQGYNLNEINNSDLINEPKNENDNGINEIENNKNYETIAFQVDKNFKDRKWIIY